MWLNASITKAMLALVYSFPNITFSMSLEKITRNTAIGILMKNIHFETKKLIFFICLRFFLAYNSVAIGMNNDIKAVGINTRRFAVGSAALYNPTSDIVLKEPMNHVSIHFTIFTKKLENNKGRLNAISSFLL